MHEEITSHRREAQGRLSAMGQRFFNMIEFDDNEELILEIRKHPFGLFLIEVGGFLVTLLLTVIPIAIALNIETLGVGSSSTVKTLLIFIGFILGILAIGATFIAAILYRNNVIFVTNEKIAQVLYTSLFNRKVSQLSIGDVQDVTVRQDGIFPRIFKYGTLVIETAGEQQNYTFSYVPNPYETGRVIVGSHEQNLKKYGN